MKKLSGVLIGAVIAATAISSLADPAYALGGCGPNRHRNWRGFCVWGGQREASCVRRTGHVATRMANGTVWCLR